MLQINFRIISKKELKMRNIKLFVALAMFGLILAGCSASKQHKDPSWTTKPSNLQVVFTAPVVLDSAKDNCPMFPWYYTP
jgi:hypothetical protein